MYRLIKQIKYLPDGATQEKASGAFKDENGIRISFIFSPDNTDYANFKREINEGTAQLQNADGELMTAEQAKDFVKELP